MRGKRFPEEQIIAIVKKHAAGAKVVDLSREINVSEIYRPSTERFQTEIERC